MLFVQDKSKIYSL